VLVHLAIASMGLQFVKVYIPRKETLIWLHYYQISQLLEKVENWSAAAQYVNCATQKSFYSPPFGSNYFTCDSISLHPCCETLKQLSSGGEKNYKVVPPFSLVQLQLFLPSPFPLLVNSKSYLHCPHTRCNISVEGGQNKFFVIHFQATWNAT
jgi:hypothetical protein